ncbi:MAG: hypothetical protein ABT940_08090 [Alphaproteobacteria bacterium]
MKDETGWDRRFESHQFLCFGQNTHLWRMVREMLRGTGAADLITVGRMEEAFAVLRQTPPQAVLIEIAGPLTLAEGLIRTIRRAPRPHLAMLPVVVLTSQDESDFLGRLRDSGVNEVVAMPLSRNALLSRLDAAVHHPRPFLRLPSYLGPDRRRETAEDYLGPRRRELDRLIQEMEAAQAQEEERETMDRQDEIEMAAFLCDTTVAEMTTILEREPGFASFLSGGDMEEAHFTEEDIPPDEVPETELPAEHPPAVEEGAMSQERLSGLLKRGRK